MAGVRQEHHAVELGEVVDLAGGQRVVDRHEGGAGVPLAHLLRGEVQPAEGAVLRGSERLDRTGTEYPSQRQTLGVDQLDGTGAGQVLGQRQGDRAAPLVEGVDRRQGARREQLEVVELRRVEGSTAGPAGGSRGRMTRASSCHPGFE